MQSDFMNKTAKLIAELRVGTCINDVDEEAIEDILKDEIIKYHNEVFTYGHTIGYDSGYIDGKSSLEEAVDNAYDKGYAVGSGTGYYDVWSF